MLPEQTQNPEQAYEDRQRLGELGRIRTVFEEYFARAGTQGGTNYNQVIDRAVVQLDAWARELDELTVQHPGSLGDNYAIFNGRELLDFLTEKFITDNLERHGSIDIFLGFLETYFIAEIRADAEKLNRRSNSNTSDTGADKAKEKALAGLSSLIQNYYAAHGLADPGALLTQIARKAELLDAVVAKVCDECGVFHNGISFEYPAAHQGNFLSMPFPNGRDFLENLQFKDIILLAETESGATGEQAIKKFMEIIDRDYINLAADLFYECQYTGDFEKLVPIFLAFYAEDPFET